MQISIVRCQNRTSKHNHEQKRVKEVILSTSKFPFYSFLFSFFVFVQRFNTEKHFKNEIDNCNFVCSICIIDENKNKQSELTKKSIYIIWMKLRMAKRKKK